MPIALLALLLSPTTVAAQPPAKPCKPQVRMTHLREPVRVQPLGAMPPAKQILGVYRERNGCAELAVVRERVGAPARR